MMKKKMLGALVLCLLSTSLFTACSKYQVGHDLTPEWQDHYSEMISEAKESLASEDLSNEERVEALRSAAIGYESFGNYKKAIEYYEQVLELDPTDYVALNNLLSIYEDLEDYPAAAVYAKTLVENYLSEEEVIRDAIRIHLQMEDVENAEVIIIAYAQEYNSEETASFISEQYDYIYRVRTKLEEEAEEASN